MLQRLTVQSTGLGDKWGGVKIQKDPEDQLALEVLETEMCGPGGRKLTEITMGRRCG